MPPKLCELCKTYKAKLTKREFDEWFEVHKSECSINYFEKSSGVMEEAAALVIFRHSLEKRKLRYTSMLRDGDNKAIEHIN